MWPKNTIFPITGTSIAQLCWADFDVHLWVRWTVHSRYGTRSFVAIKEFRGQVICISVNERHLAEIDFSVVLSLKYYRESHPFLLSLLFYINFLETVFYTGSCLLLWLIIFHLIGIMFCKHTIQGWIQ